MNHTPVPWRCKVRTDHRIGRFSPLFIYNNAYNMVILYPPLQGYLILTLAKITSQFIHAICTTCLFWFF